MTTTDFVRVALVKCYATFNPEALVDVLRPHLQWENISRGKYNALTRGMVFGDGWTILTDRSPSDIEPDINSIDDALAWVANQPKPQARKTSVKKTSAKVPVKTKVKPKQLTTAQLRELEELRKELGVNEK